MLAARLASLRPVDTVVLGLPRGGVPVAAEVARVLACPLDVVLVRKLGLPWQQELAFGAIGEDGVLILNDDIVREAGMSSIEIQRVEQREREELERRVLVYRRRCEQLSLRGKTAIIVDDGLATGATARAACAVVRDAGASRVVLAVPVAPEGWERSFIGDTDEQMSLFTSADFGSVGYFYDDFHAIDDDEVVALLLASRQAGAERDVCEVMGTERVEAHLVLAGAPIATALFVHGTGSSRRSPRNLAMAQQLAKSGVSSVLVDLNEDLSEDLSIDDVMEAVVTRLVGVIRWIRQDERLLHRPIVLIGSSSGAAVATAVALREEVLGVVARGGNFSAVSDEIERLDVPVMMIVGSRDHVTLEANRVYCARLGDRCHLALVEGASHVFEEPGAIEEAARLAAQFIVEATAS